jgi:hypothetical protein
MDQGREDIDCRILHVYHSNKRAGFVSNSESVKSTNTEGKRKHSASDKKKRQVRKVATAGTIMRSPGLLEGDLLSSPCHSQLSINLDTDLDFNSTNLFDDTTPIDQNFSFMPIRGAESHSMEDMMLYNAAFNSAVARHSTGYQGQYAHTLHPNVQGRNAHGGDWTVHTHSPPKEKPPSYATDFSKRLMKAEDDLLAEVHGSKSTADQILKLQLLQNWAKGIAHGPLQPRKEPALESGEASTTTRPDTGMQETIKMESPGTPNITP